MLMKPRRPPKIEQLPIRQESTEETVTLDQEVEDKTDAPELEIEDGDTPGCDPYNNTGSFGIKKYPWSDKPK